VVTEEAVARSDTGRARARLSGVVAWLTIANVLNGLTGFVTGPLLARALGPAGRGELQAIRVPLALAPFVFSLGISSFAYRSLPRGRSAQEVLGSLGLPLLVLGVIGAVVGIPLADLFAAGRHTVRTFLVIGFALMPLSVLTLLLSSSLAALERWRAVVAMTVIPFALPFVATVVLYVVGDLTVASASIAQFAASELALIPAVPLLLRTRRLVFRFSLAREGVIFGAKAWLGGLAQTANLRLDQVLMITLVSSRELGLYAVATTISTAPGFVTGAVSPPLMTRIAGGERYLMPRAIRITVALSLVVNLLVALITPTLLTVVFGREFRDAIPMTLLLLGAAVPFAGAQVLSTALAADGAPMIPTVGEGMALIVTVGGLLVLLGPLQGVGAAIVSLAAYSSSFVFQLIMARRRLNLPLREFVIPKRADLSWATGRMSDTIFRHRAVAS
jgi:O-antigen/teichoic acid export membrane protein